MIQIHLLWHSPLLLSGMGKSEQRQACGLLGPIGQEGVLSLWEWWRYWWPYMAMQ